VAEAQGGHGSSRPPRRVNVWKPALRQGLANAPRQNGGTGFGLIVFPTWHTLHL